MLPPQRQQSATTTIAKMATSLQPCQGMNTTGTAEGGRGLETDMSQALKGMFFLKYFFYYSKHFFKM
jgi:hypothetical protein